MGDAEFVLAVRTFKKACADHNVALTIGTNKLDKTTGRVYLDLPKHIFDKVK